MDGVSKGIICYQHGYPRLVSRPGQSHWLLYKHCCSSFTEWVLLFLQWLYGSPAPKPLEMVPQVKNKRLKLVEDYKSWRESKLHTWFKSYGDFAELVDFAYWWRCIRKGLQLQPVQQACIYIIDFIFVSFFCIILRLYIHFFFKSS